MWSSIGNRLIRWVKGTGFLEDFERQFARLKGYLFEMTTHSLELRPLS